MINWRPLGGAESELKVPASKKSLNGRRKITNKVSVDAMLQHKAFFISAGTLLPMPPNFRNTSMLMPSPNQFLSRFHYTHKAIGNNALTNYH